MCKGAVVLSWVGKAILDSSGRLLVSLVEFEKLTEYTFGFHLGFCQLLSKYLKDFVLN